MNDEYMYVNGEVLVRSKGHLKKKIRYQDNFEKILICENVIDRLKSDAIRDTIRLNHLIASRSKHVTAYSIVTPLATGASIAGAVSFSEVVTEFAGRIQVSSFIGPITITDAYLMIAIPTVVVSANVLTSYILFNGPSRKDIAGLRERIRYEQESIESYEETLEALKKDTSCEKEQFKHDDELYQTVPDAKMFKIVRELRELRYEYGQNPRSYLHKNLKHFAKKLSHEGYQPETIAEFITFIESERQTYTEEKRLKKEK